MKTCRMILPALLMFLLATGAYSRADEIWMKNGDRLTGTVVGLEGDALVFRTPYAGEIAVAWQEVQNLQTDTPIRIVLGDDTSARGTLSRTGPGRAALSSETFEEPVSLSLEDIRGINPETPPAVRLKARANVGASRTRGNTRTDSFYGDAEVVARTEANRYTIQGMYKLSEENDIKTADRLYGAMKYDHFFSQAFYAYANATGEKDDFKDLNLRSSLGLGVGYQFFETPLTNLSVEAGLSYVNEDYTLAQDQDYAAGRWGFNYDRFFLGESFQFFHRHQGLMSVEDTEDVSVLSQTGIRIPLRAGLNVAFQFNYDWDNSPSPGTKSEDKTYLFTLGYEWENR